MAGGAATVMLPPHPTLQATATATATATARSYPKDRWDVEFARFFCYPRWSSSAGGTSTLNRWPGRKIRSNGTWIVADSASVLRIARSASVPVPVLSVTVAGFVVEEHFVSNLHFSWPQVSCVSQCPIRGSRAVFLSYRDSSGQIQKFAVRFPAGFDAEKFLYSVKECLHKTADIAPLGCDIVCENSSPSEFTASNRLHYRFDEDSSYEEPVATYAPEVPEPVASCAPKMPEPVATCAPKMPALTYNVEQPECSLPSNNIEMLFSDFPPSFTELLSNCLADAEKEKLMARESAMSLNEGYSPGPPAHGGAVLPDLTTDADVKSGTVKYMTDASFHDMLSKIEKVMDEMGGDLSL